MFTHWFAFVMAGTFVAAILAMLAGVVNLSGPRDDQNSAPSGAASRSTTLMMLRVGLCFLLLCEIIFYLVYIK
jgi:hypothetical protein